jgi:hypothetical protein
LLPFLKKKQTSVSGLIIKDRAPNTPAEEPINENAGMECCAMDLIIAVHTKDVKATAEALRNAFDMLEAEEDKQETTVSPHTYAAQNVKAGEES